MYIFIFIIYHVNMIMKIVWFFFISKDYCFKCFSTNWKKIFTIDFAVRCIAWPWILILVKWRLSLCFILRPPVVANSCVSSFYYDATFKTCLKEANVSFRLFLTSTVFSFLHFLSFPIFLFFLFYLFFNCLLLPLLIVFYIIYILLPFPSLFFHFLNSPYLNIASGFSSVFLGLMLCFVLLFFSILFTIIPPCIPFVFLLCL